MPNKLVKVRLPEIGRLRLGAAKEPNRPGKPLDTFRFTSGQKRTVEMVASIYGGDVQPYSGVDGPEWEVVVERRALKVLIPAHDSYTSWQELWSGGLLDRRCDGETAVVTEDSPDGPIPVERPCLCAAETDDQEDYACSPKMRISLLLADLPVTGQVMLSTGSWNAHAEMMGVLELASEITSQREKDNRPALPFPALLWIRSDTTRSRIYGTRHFKYPVLVLTGSLAELSDPPASAGAITDTSTGEIVEMEEQVSQAALT